MNARDTAGVVAPPPLIALGALVCGGVLEQIIPLGRIAQTPGTVRWVIAIALSVLAVSIFALAILSFQRAGTAVQTRRPSTALVTTGVYSFVRNPIYVGFFLILISIAVAAAWDWLLIFAALFLGVVHWGVVRREERYLEGKFGEAYAAYIARVRRYGLF